MILNIRQVTKEEPKESMPEVKTEIPELSDVIVEIGPLHASFLNSLKWIDTEASRKVTEQSATSESEDSEEEELPDRHFEVDKIIKHKRYKTLVEEENFPPDYYPGYQRLFLIKWKDVDPTEEYSWEPRRSIRDLDIFKNYVKKHGLSMDDDGDKESTSKRTLEMPEKLESVTKNFKEKEEKPATEKGKLQGYSLIDMFASVPVPQKNVPKKKKQVEVVPSPYILEDELSELKRSISVITNAILAVNKELTTTKDRAQINEAISHLKDPEKLLHRLQGIKDPADRNRLLLLMKPALPRYNKTSRLN